ncbi:MAG: PLP-dependent aminotransferase family protein [Acidobacteriota bacterium]|nr:PLP-dependent aminotransferase family protein [Blastocatellia bacterium]MDW8412321.1 PLP-dependent aminotransferase family protein [Acidobacteriota bacterium]
MLIKLDRDSHTPVYEQIKEHIVGLILAGRLKPGDRLPSSRSLAESLGVNRTTVCTAYEELEADGYVASHVGQGTYVLPQQKLQVGISSGQQSLLRPRFSRRSELLHRHKWEHFGEGRVDRILFSGLTPEEDLFPIELFRSAINNCLRERGKQLLQYGDPQGYRPLREYLSMRLARYSISASVEQIVIVSGSQQGLDLVMRILTDPGDRVVIESPTYPELFPVLAQYQAEIVTVPVGNYGLELDQLEQRLREKPVQLAYVMPNFHNPTGATMQLEQREKLVEIAQKYGTILIEDDYEKDLRLEGTPIVPVKALDSTGAVLYLGTFSKGLFPGARVAWIVAQEAIVERLVQAKRCLDFQTNLLMQAALAEFCAQGYYDAHLKRIHKIYRLRRRRLLEALEREMPEGVSWTRPEGGYAVWVTMPQVLDAAELLDEARKHGIFFIPGTQFYIDGSGKNCFRLCFSRTDAEQIDEGVAVLGTLIREKLRRIK